MRRGYLGLMVVISCAVVASCAEMGGGAGAGEMGDLPAVDDGAVGGISEVPNPTRAMASAAGKPLSRLERGHEVYMLKCGECHEYMLPQDLDIDEWEDVMPKMIGHAGLPPEDENAVLDYVVGVKKQQGE